MKTQKDINMLYDCLGKLEIVELVMKYQGIDVKEIQKVKEQIQGQLKRV